MTRPISEVASTGRFLPDRVLTNEDWTRMVDTTEQWIVERTGIHERRVASPCTSVCDMGVAAAEQALERAGVSAAESALDVRVRREDAVCGLRSAVCGLRSAYSIRHLSSPMSSLFPVAPPPHHAVAAFRPAFDFERHPPRSVGHR